MSTFRLAALAALLVGWAAPALAEDGQQSGSAITEEIIVTATYRETNLMDTAQSINAITDDFVEDVGAQSMADVFMMVPGLNMTGSRDGDNRYSVRGLTSQTGRPAITWSAPPSASIWTVRQSRRRWDRTTRSAATSSTSSGSRC